MSSRRTEERPLTDHEMIEMSVLRHLLLQFFKEIERTAHHEGVETQQYSALLMIEGTTLRGKAPTLTEFARSLALETQSASELVDRLEEKGLVQRVKNTVDARRRHIHLTGSGQRIVHDIAKHHFVLIREMIPAVITVEQRILSWPPP